MASKRERQPNWNISEITLLQELVEKDEFVLKSKQTNTITNNKKNEKWAEICSKINAMGLQKRTMKQVIYKWGNLQQNAKKTYTEVKKQRKLTGGGPAPKPPSAVEEKIIEMMKDRPNFSGISCGFESTMPPVFEIGLVEKAKNMHAEIQSYLDNYTERYNLPRANDVHLIPFLEPSVESSYSENQIDELVNFLCSKYPSLQDISSRDISSLIHNIVQFIVNYRQGGTPNGSFVESELDNSQQPCFSARVGDGQTGSVSSMFPESSFTSIPRSSKDSTSSIALISLTEEFAVEEDASSSSIAKKPDGKRKRVSLGDLQTMQYEMDTTENVLLNVSGKLYQIHKNVQCKLPKSQKSQLISYNGTDQVEHFYYKNRELFERVINYLGGSSLHIPNTMCPVEFEEELEFWKIDTKELSPCCYIKYKQRENVTAMIKKFLTHRRKKFDKDQSRIQLNKPYLHQLRNAVWDIIEFNTKSTLSKVYLILSTFFILSAVFGIALSTLPVFREKSMIFFGKNKLLHQSANLTTQTNKSLLWVLDENKPISDDLNTKTYKGGLLISDESTTKTHTERLPISDNSTTLTNTGRLLIPNDSTTQTHKRGLLIPDDSTTERHKRRLPVSDESTTQTHKKIIPISSESTIQPHNEGLPVSDKSTTQTHKERLPISDNFTTQLHKRGFLKPDGLTTQKQTERFPMPDDSTSQTYITDDFIPNRTLELTRDIVHRSFLPGQISSKFQSFYSNTEENVFSALYYMTNSFFILDVLCRIVCSPNLKTILTDILIMFDIFITLCAIVWYTLQVYDYHLDYLLYVQIFRVLGLFRILQHIHAFKVLGYTLNFSKRDLLALMMYVCVVIIIMSNFLYFVENTNDFTSIPETWWYTVVTMTTLGYGDMVPATVVGKIIGALSVIIGFLLFSLIIPIMATRFMTLYDMTDIEDFNLGEKEAKEECVQLKSV